MIVKTIKVGYLQTNCYILIKGNNALIIDPGDDYDIIINELGNYNLKGILITHNHFDHVGALKYFKNTNIYNYNNLEEKEYEIDNFKFDVIYTKGHTSDSITFYFKDDNTMFVGDFIFKYSIGRTDLETGNIKEMNQSIRNIKTYPKETIIYPGHGNKTLLKDEIMNNPYF